MKYILTDLINKIKNTNYVFSFNEKDLNKCAIYENYWM